MWYILTREYYSTTKKEWKISTCRNRDGLGRHCAKWNVRQRKTNTIYHLYVGSKNIQQINE